MKPQSKFFCLFFEYNAIGITIFRNERVVLTCAIEISADDFVGSGGVDRGLGAGTGALGTGPGHRHRARRGGHAEGRVGGEGGRQSVGADGGLSALDGDVGQRHLSPTLKLPYHSHTHTSHFLQCRTKRVSLSVCANIYTTLSSLYRGRGWTDRRVNFKKISGLLRQGMELACLRGSGIIKQVKQVIRIPQNLNEYFCKWQIYMGAHLKNKILLLPTLTTPGRCTLNEKKNKKQELRMSIWGSFI